MRQFYILFIGLISALPLMASVSNKDNTVIAIINARVLPADPAIEINDATVLIKGQYIAAVGKEIEIPPSAKVIDAKGNVVTPGLVAANTTLAISEINAGANASDVRAGATQLSAGYDTAYAVNCHSTLIPIARLGGITRAVVVPLAKNTGDTLFAGQASVIHLGAPPTCLVTPRIGVAANLIRANIRVGRGAAMVLLNSALDDARLFMRSASAYQRGKLRALSLPREDLQALLPVIKGDIPLAVQVDRASDIVSLLELARRQNIQLIIESGAEGWKVADRIAAANVPVVIDANNSMPMTFDRLHASMENAARLHKAGVVIVIRGENDGHFARNARFNAGIAIAHGLPWQAALQAITVNPARIWGATTFGTLAPGQEADVVIWSGDPFEPLTQPLAVIIRGQQQSLQSRHTLLRDRYKTINSRIDNKPSRSNLSN